MKKICPLFHNRNDYSGACLEEKCMFHRKGNKHRKDNCWYLLSLMVKVEAWEIRE